MRLGNWGKQVGYCLYAHINPTNDMVYIGLSKDVDKRWAHKEEGYKHCPKMYNAFKKYGWDHFLHIVMFDELTREEANQREQMWIKFYKKGGKSYNITDGGEGVLGKPLTDHQKQVLREGFARYFSNLTDAEKEILKEKNKELRRKLQGKTVYAFNADTKELVAEYDSISRAAEELGTTYCCIKRAAAGKVPWASGYLWSFSPTIDPDNPIYKRRKSRKGPLYCYNLKGEHIKTFESMKDAVAFVGGVHAGISACCKDRIHAYKGYIWRRELVEIDQKVLDKVKNRIV